MCVVDSWRHLLMNSWRVKTRNCLKDWLPWRVRRHQRRLPQVEVARRSNLMYGNTRACTNTRCKSFTLDNQCLFHITGYGLLSDSRFYLSRVWIWLKGASASWCITENRICVWLIETGYVGCTLVYKQNCVGIPTLARQFVFVNPYFQFTRSTLLLLHCLVILVWQLWSLVHSRNYEDNPLSCLLPIVVFNLSVTVEIVARCEVWDAQ